MEREIKPGEEISHLSFGLVTRMRLSWLNLQALLKTRHTGICKPAYLGRQHISTETSCEVRVDSQMSCGPILHVVPLYCM